MRSRILISVIFVCLVLLAARAASPSPQPAGEYAKHFAPLRELSVAVAQAMPPDQYSFRPHPESMTFGELMLHIASTNYQFCAGLKDSAPRAATAPSAADKASVVEFLAASFDYCSPIISSLTEAQMTAPHNSPDGRLPGREVLLAMYIHVAHHRGQAEIYLRDRGIRPPNYRI